MGGTTNKVGKLKKTVEVFVAYGLSHTALLGMYFLRTYNAKLETEENKMILKMNDITIVHKLIRIPKLDQGINVVLKDETRLPARSEMYVEGKVQENIEDGKLQYFHPITNDLPVLTAYALAIVRNNNINVRLLNTTNEDIIIKRGTVVGAINDLDEDNIFDDDFVQEEKKTKTNKKEKVKDDKTSIGSLDIGETDTPPEAKRKRKELLTKYADIFSKAPSDLGKHGKIQHKIEIIGDKPKRCGVRPLTPPLRREMKQHLQEILDADIIESSTSEYSSPVVLVKKKDGSMRFCLDFRALNKVTRLVTYPLPCINDALNNLSGATVFSTLDLRSGYHHQIEMDPNDIFKTLFSTPHGQFEFLCMPQGLSNSAGTFQRVMDCIL